MDSITLDIDDESMSDDTSSRDQHVQVSMEESFKAFNLVSEELENESKAFVEQTGNGEEPFDLRSYLHDSQIKDVDGKPKRLGVSVKNLTVVGLAPENSVISNNLTPFVSLTSLLNPHSWYGDQLV